MRPVDTAALETAAWTGFVSRLAEHLAGQWPVMADQLRDRLPGFIALALKQADELGIRRAANIARYANLWFVWGPAFHDKPGFEWAQTLTAPAREAAAAARAKPRQPAPSWHRADSPSPADALLVHQLLQASLQALQQLPGARVDAPTLAAADARLVEVFGHLGCRGALHLPAPPLPQKTCDLEAADLRVLDDGVLYRYEPDGAANATTASATATTASAAARAAHWHRVPGAVPAPLRVDATRPLPECIHLLSRTPDQGAATRFQVRLRHHAVCDQDTHPLLGFSGAFGRWVWQGHEALAASWPVAARAAPWPRSGPGSAIAEETSPELCRLELEVCGLRDSGQPVGGAQAMVAVWPAAQWWLAVQRTAAPTQALLPGPRAWAPGATRCRLEVDGQALDAAGLQQHFEQGLDAATAAGLHALAAAWAALPGLQAATVDARIGLLTGQAALTWGWQHGPAGLAEAAQMRLLGGLDLAACDADLQLGGDCVVDGARSRLALTFAGRAELKHLLRRETAQVPMAEAVGQVVARWRFPAALSVEPLAVESGSLLQLAGPVTGALVGEAGLRPCTLGGSGYVWFVALRLEAVAAPLQLVDPLLGQRQWQQPMLPARTLVDWSLG